MRHAVWVAVLGSMLLMPAVDYLLAGIMGSRTHSANRSEAAGNFSYCFRESSRRATAHRASGNGGDIAGPVEARGFVERCSDAVRPRGFRDVHPAGNGISEDSEVAAHRQNDCKFCMEGNRCFASNPMAPACLAGVRSSAGSYDRWARPARRHPAL